MKPYSAPAILSTEPLTMMVCGVRKGGLTAADRTALMQAMIDLVADGRRESRDPKLRAAREEARANLECLRRRAGVR